MPISTFVYLSEPCNYTVCVLFFFSLFFHNRMTQIILARQTQPWLQPDWLFGLSSLGADQKRCLSILHNFTDQVIICSHQDGPPNHSHNKHFYAHCYLLRFSASLFEVIRERKAENRKIGQQRQEDSPEKDNDEFVSSKNRIMNISLFYTT